MLNLKKMLKSALIILVMGFFVNLVFAELLIRRQITQPITYLKKIILTDNGLSDGNQKISIDGTNGIISLSGTVSIGDEFCLRGVCKTSFDSVWGQSGSSVSYVGGNVGIGKSNPSYALDVSGSVNTSRIRIGEEYLGGSLYRSLVGNNEFLSPTDISVFRNNTGKAELVIHDSGITVGDNVGQSSVFLRGKRVGTYDASGIFFGDEANSLRYSITSRGTADTTNGNMLLQYFSTGSGNVWKVPMGIYPDSLNSPNYSVGLKDSTIYINSSNNVGIGTVSPGYKLDVSGVINSATVRIGESYNGGSLFRGLQGANEYVATQPYHIFRNSSGQILGNINRDGLSVGSNIRATSIAINGNGQGNRDASKLWFGDEKNQYRYSMGIQGSLASTKGDWNLIYFSTGSGEQRRSPISVYPDALNSPDYTLALKDNSLIVNKDGKVGIHTFSPNGDLHVMNTVANAEIDIQSLTGDGQHWGIYQERTNGQLSFYTNRDDKFVITTGAKVGIGLNDPQARLDVLGDALIRGENRFSTNGDEATVYFGDSYKYLSAVYGGEMKFMSNDPIRINSDSTIIVGANNSSNQMFLNTNGRVGIGNITPQTKLHVTGELRINSCVQKSDGSAIAGTCSSDLRLKKDISPINNTLSKISSLRPVTYYRKRDDGFKDYFGTGQAAGLIAQEVEKIFPELVSTDENGYKRVNYGVELDMYMIEALKELNEQRKIMKLELDGLKNNTK